MFRLLLIERQEDTELKKQLEERYRLFTASSIKKANRIIREEGIEVILLKNPKIKISNLHQGIQNINTTPPIILAVPNNSIKQAVPFMEKGGSDFITTPIDVNILSLKIKHSIKIKSQTVSLQRAKEQKDKACRLSNAKTDFIASMSHELRTPLASILGYAQTMEMMEDNGKITKKMRKRFTNNIVAAGSHLNSLVNDLLDIVKIESGELDINFKPVNLSDILRNVEANLLGNISKKDIDLKINISRKIPPVKADPKRLLQVLINLIGNAIKFTKSGFVEISCLVEKSMITISVKDSGCGIAPESLKDVFTRFKQLDSNINVGSGLGLDIAKRLVELMGGEIVLQSKVKEGTTASFRLQLWDKAYDQKLGLQEKALIPFKCEREGIALEAVTLSQAS